MKSSLRMRAVNEMDTMCRNSFSKSTRDMIMMAAPTDVSELIIRHSMEKKKKQTLV